MPDKASVVARLKENPAYVAAFSELFGKNSLDDTEQGYAAMTKAIAAFERTPEFSPFDSKYDRYLRGETTLTEQEELGRVLFFSSQFTNCSQCHRLETQGGIEKELFTNFEYHNIGTPLNHAVRAENGSEPGRIDRGLLANPAVTDKIHDGQFKVPTLRNVAVTGALYAQRRLQGPAHGRAVLQQVQQQEPEAADQPRDQRAVGGAGGARESLDEGARRRPRSTTSVSMRWSRS